MAERSTLTGDLALHLPQFDQPPNDPIDLLGQWVSLASDRGVREPRAMTLATVGKSGRPSSRTVLLKEVSKRGLVFTSSRAGRKFEDFQSQPFVSVTMYWRETLQQLNIAGKIGELDSGESDVLFSQRPKAAQAAVLVSMPGEMLLSDDELVRRAAAVETDDVLSRPSSWSGFVIEPDFIEFWHGRPNRIHRRLIYRRTSSSWTHERLQP